MASTRFSQPDQRKVASSPRPKGRENAKDTLCRNVLIYGHCRYEDQGCAFNHDPNKTLSPPSDMSAKKALSVDSPAFTPATLSVPGKTSTISSQAVNAAPFTPRGLASGTVTPVPQAETEAAATFNPAQIKEFTPQQNYDMSTNIASNGTAPDAQMPYDPFSMSSVADAMPSAPYNPYLQDNSAMPSNGAAYYQAQPSFAAPAQPLQYHLYAPIGPHKEDLTPYQRTVHDFFIPNSLREELQKKSEATRQVMPNSGLPRLEKEKYHSLVPLDTNNNKSAAVFGFPSWVYKAQKEDGNYYVLRRLEGYRLSNAGAIARIKEWKHIHNGGVVSVINSFTTQAFGDSSLIFVYNYHPMSKTLAETHFAPTNRYGHRAPANEQVLWSYIVQLASAIKAVHGTNLAVRCLEASKVILTEKNRVRLSGCAVLDVVQFEANRPIHELQQEDFIHFGRLILSIATNNQHISVNAKISVEQLLRAYTPDFRSAVIWLLTPAHAPNTKNINDFLASISSHLVSSYDASLHANDGLNSILMGELENGRLVRLVTKLGLINERPEYEGQEKWSEVGERYILKLFRDFVFHARDPVTLRPKVDLGYILTHLNKLDAGSNEQIKLISRDEQDCIIVTYKEVKKQILLAFAELSKPAPVVKGGRIYQ
ncbi:hypothetical protein N431DRAFT_432215 [Stipitochalara longipes BDJ]|nr:hypothetical protein N431DRAFT_432215 [Stipitochalara longipes BDJ]